MGTRTLVACSIDMAGAIGCEELAADASTKSLVARDDWMYMWREAIQQVLISEAELQRRIQSLGQAITADYRDKELLVIPILKGALLFAADLARAIDLPLTVDCLTLSSYGVGQVSSGEVRVLKDLDEDLTGKHVLIVEDIIDTGHTLQYLMHHLLARHPADVNVCVLLDKRARRQVDVPVKYRGFDVPDAFVVGYGLDYQGRYRNLPYIGILHPEVFAGSSRAFP
jgi:hypoxanthine phosphoribosyltransferase